MWIVLVTGALLEAAGILLVAWPDMRHETLQVACWARDRVVSARRWFSRRVLRRRAVGYLRTGIVVEREGPVPGSMVVGTVPDGLPVEEQLRLLIAHDELTQRRVGELANRVGELERQLDERIADHDETMRDHVEGRLRAAQDEYRYVRVAGAALVVVGLALQVAASLI